MSYSEVIQKDFRFFEKKLNEFQGEYSGADFEGLLESAYKVVEGVISYFDEHNEEFSFNEKLFLYEIIQSLYVVNGNPFFNLFHSVFVDTISFDASNWNEECLKKIQSEYDKLELSYFKDKLDAIVILHNSLYK